MDSFKFDERQWILSHAASVSYACNISLASDDWILYPTVRCSEVENGQPAVSLSTDLSLNRRSSYHQCTAFLSIGNSRFQSCTEKYDFQALRLRRFIEGTVEPLARGLLTSLMVHLSRQQDTSHILVGVRGSIAYRNSARVSSSQAFESLDDFRYNVGH